MKYEDVRLGQTVWITGGTDKGKQGTVEDKGWGVVRVTLIAPESKIIDALNLTTTDPNSHNVPLPPSFIPSEFKIGDPVEVYDHEAGDYYNGIKGKIVRLPTSTSFRNGGDPRYGIEVTGKGHKTFTIGNGLFFNPQNLRKPTEKVRYVGDEIGHEDVQIGDTIRTEIRSADGTYNQLSSKEGKVARITKRVHGHTTGLEPWQIYSFATEKHHGLTFEHRDERITLLEIAVDPYVAIVENLAAGTVVVHEKGTGEVLTYVKSLPFVNQTQWHFVSSMSNRSSTFADDRDVIDALNNGAEIVHKVRKPAKKPIPVPPPF